MASSGFVPLHREGWPVISSGGAGLRPLSAIALNIILASGSAPAGFARARQLFRYRQRKQEDAMIVAVVRFKLREGTSLEEAKAVFDRSAPMYRGRDGLKRKHYLFGNGVGGGVYLWESRAKAEALYTPEWREMITQRYGAPPDIQFFDSPLTIDNEGEADIAA
jgi:hypothetical protein